jgi:tRNA 2-thiouridine synthesizing protein A
VAHRRLTGERMTDFDVELDARGLSCPLPILRAKKSLSDMDSGQVLRVIATDKGAPNDLAEFCWKTGNVLLSSTAENSEFVFLIRRR